MHTRYQVGLQALKGWELQIVYTYQEVTSGSHGFETPARTCICGVRTMLHDLAGSEHKVVHDYKVQDLTDSEHQIVHAYQEGAAGSHG